MYKCKKSQIVVADLFIAMFIATMLIIIIIFTWNNYAILLDENIEYNEMQIIAFQTADLLVKSKGEPVNWEYSPNNVDAIGLASSDRVISEEKVGEFVNLPYNVTSKLLGVDLYDFRFELNHINGTMMEEYGKTPEGNKSIVSVQRIVSYKNEKAVVEFVLWK
ncbi:MAG: hypothetical protein U9O94_01045 [Nanoarchaeota archaeon]|nr:hypothetical protein [Nanoarchaeota archaeon]